MKSIRLQKYIANCGVTSRRKAEQLILEGRVFVNGTAVTSLGSKVSSDDTVVVDGKAVSLEYVQKVYLILNKPRGYITTVSDPEGRKTVMDLIPDTGERIYPVGRLDYLSEGLLFFTNDGEIADKIMHPSHNVIKVYEVKIFGIVTKEHLNKLREGFTYGKKIVKPKSVRAIKHLPSKTWLEFRIGEGKNREIRRLCESANLVVDKLRRVSIGGIHIEGIAPGKYVFLTKREILQGLGFNDSRIQEYFSSKKTINVEKRRFSNVPKADARSYRRFKREVYFETLQKEDR